MAIGGLPSKWPAVSAGRCLNVRYICVSATGASSPRERAEPTDTSTYISLISFQPGVRTRASGKEILMSDSSTESSGASIAGTTSKTSQRSAAAISRRGERRAREISRGHPAARRCGPTARRQARRYAVRDLPANMGLRPGRSSNSISRRCSHPACSNTSSS